MESIKYALLALIMIGVTAQPTFAATESVEDKIEIISPSADDAFKAKEKVKVTWNSDDGIKKVDLVLIAKDGETETVLARRKKNTGSYIWKVPKKLATGYYKIKVSETSDSETDVTTETEWFVVGDVAAKIKDGRTHGTSKQTLTAYLDLQDPYSRQWYRDVFPNIKKDYINKNKLSVVFKDFPIASLHSDADDRAVAALCAAEQGKHLAMIDQIFKDIFKDYSRKEVMKFAEKIELNATAFGACIDSSDALDAVRADANEAKKAGYPGTPTFITGSAVIMGSQSFRTFQEALN